MQRDDFATALADLHARRIAGHAGNFLERISELLYPPLLIELASRRRFRGVDHDLIADAVVDALMEYFKKPQGYRPSSGMPLDRHIALAAHRNLLNTLRSEGRRRKHEAIAAQQKMQIPQNDVELGSPAGNVISKEIAGALKHKQEQIRALMTTDIDRRIVELRLNDERRTSAYAEVMGIAHLPIDQQRKEVKRAKDRIDKIIVRAEIPSPTGESKD